MILRNEQMPEGLLFPIVLLQPDAFRILLTVIIRASGRLPCCLLIHYLALQYIKTNTYKIWLQLQITIK